MYSQLHNYWADVALGTSGRATIGSHGCLLVCGSEMLYHSEHSSYFAYKLKRHTYNPGWLNRWMCQNDGFVSGNRIVFAKLGELARLSVEVVDCSQVPAPMDKIENTLAVGGYPIVKVDFRPGGSVQQHWVRILELVDNDALIHDPWLDDGGPYWLMQKYGHYTWPNVARAVYRMALYTRPEKGALDFSVRPSGLCVQESLSPFPVEVE